MSISNNDNIWILASDNKLQEIQHLLALGQVDINAQDEHGYSALHAAVSYGHEELTRFLLSNGAQVNLVDEDGETPLFVCEELPCLLLLLNAGADPFWRNQAGKTAAEVGAEEGDRPQVCEYLINNYPGCYDAQNVQPSEEEIRNWVLQKLIEQEGEDGGGSD